MSPHNTTCANCSTLVADPSADHILGTYCFAHAFAHCYTTHTPLRYCPHCEESDYFRVEYLITIPDLDDQLRTSSFQCSFSFEGNNLTEAFYCDPEVPSSELEGRLGYIIRGDQDRDTFFWYASEEPHEPSNRPSALRSPFNADLRQQLLDHAQSTLTRATDYGYCEECGESFIVTD